MSIEIQWILIAVILLLLLGIWVVIGKPNGTEIFLSLLSPLEYLDKAAFRVAEIADDEGQPQLKRNFARAVKYVGLKLLFVAVIAGIVFVLYGRAIRRAFGWY